MEVHQLEEAIKSDLKTLTTLKMGFVSANKFYGKLLGLACKLSFLFLAINTVVQLVLKGMGQFNAPFTLTLLCGSWLVCFMMSLFLALILSRFVLLSRLIKGRLKTEILLKKTLKHLGSVCLVIYTVIYALTTMLSVSGAESDVVNDPAFLMFTILFPQAFSFIVSTGITGLMSSIELDRLGLGVLFNVLSDLLSKAKKSAPHSLFDKDA
ncbi:TPA: hypothetical protein ACTUT5_003439 [Legionella anisa]|uniref:hypothetical protein n=1 Tax=Legionella anisa TaxID=28082 RepID=UPI00197FCC1F|nr:hypothetical protein [Legionella anisa]MBN5937218.1 hypothetical protein [Legionella anisa]